jgi:hydrogenase-4 membrane subunit HyfE
MKRRKNDEKREKKPRKEDIMAFITHMVVSKTHFPVIPVMVETAVGVVSNYLRYDHRI